MKPFLFALSLFLSVTVFSADSEGQSGFFLCSDSSICHISSTCCPTQFHNFGCCALANAICCSEPFPHCCPGSMACSNHAPYCVTKTKNESTENLMKRSNDDEATIDSLALVEVVQTVVDKLVKVGNDSNTCKEDPSGSCLTNQKCCYDHASSNSSGNSTNKFAGCCPVTATCCNDASNGAYYGYCPVSNGVCCSDKKHCCPQGFECSPSGTNCFKQDDNPQQQNQNPSESLERFDQPILAPLGFKAHQMKHANSSNDGLFDDSQVFKTLFRRSVEEGSPHKCPSDPPVYCNEKYTCCSVESNKYMCCPLENAVCCGDNETCCPHGTTCDVTNHICTS